VSFKNWFVSTTGLLKNGSLKQWCGSYFLKKLKLSTDPREKIGTDPREEIGTDPRHLLRNIFTIQADATVLHSPSLIHVNQ
jgi:hypothetical protein